MLRFNRFPVLETKTWKEISIHPMLRFNFAHLIIMLNIGYFNTSYVTVQLFFTRSYCRFFWISIHPMLRFNDAEATTTISRDSISIHPMLRFNKTTVLSLTKFKRFQYILCYGSTLIIVNGYFNIFKFQYILCYGSTISNLFRNCPK